MNQLAAAKSLLSSSRKDELAQRTQQYRDGQDRDRFRALLEADSSLTPEDRTELLSEFTSTQMEMRDRRRRIKEGEDLDVLGPESVARPLLTPEEEYRRGLPPWRILLRAAFVKPMPTPTENPEMPPLESYVPSKKEIIKSKLQGRGFPYPEKRSVGALALEKYVSAPLMDEMTEEYVKKHPEKFTAEDLTEEKALRKLRDERIQRHLEAFQNQYRIDVEMRKHERSVQALLMRQASEFMATLPEAKTTGASRAGRYIEGFMRGVIYRQPTYKAMSDRLRNKRLRLSADPRASTLKGSGRSGFLLVGMVVPAACVILVSYAYDRITSQA